MEGSYLLKDRIPTTTASSPVAKSSNHQPPAASGENKEQSNDPLQLNSVISRWSSGTKLEKILSIILLIVSLLCIILLVMLTSQSFPNARNDQHPLSKSNLTTGYSIINSKILIPICEHKDCTIAASDIIEALDENEDPCKDFVKFSCGGWIKKNPVPEDSAKWSQFDILSRRLNIIFSSILDKSENTSDPEPIQKARTFYSGCLNETKLESKGLTPLIKFLNRFGGWPMTLSDWDEDSFDWMRSTAESRKQLEQAFLVSVDVRTDMKKTTKNALYIDQPSLGLPRLVLIKPEDYKERISAYKKFIASVALLLAHEMNVILEEKTLKQDVEELYEFETKLANISTADEDRRDTNVLYNKMTVQELIELSDNNTNWLDFLNIIFSPVGVEITSQTPVIVMERGYIINITRLINKTKKNVVSNYLLWRIVASLGGETTKAMRDASTEYKKVAHGIKSLQSRNVICGNKAIRLMGMAIGTKYTETQFPKETKNAANLMIENIRSAFIELLSQNQWMDDETKPLARNKANVVTQVIGYPEWYETPNGLEKYYEDLEAINKEEHFQNMMTLSSFRNQDCLKKLNKPADKNKWFTTPVIVNAFYEPVFNSITFPAAILQPPFYRSTAPQYLNYGGIGQVIGHEITHGFDDQGRQYNENGNAVPWWSERTVEKFKQKAQCIIDQYQGFLIPELNQNIKNASVNGKTTQGENIADNGGLRAAYFAYKNYVSKNGEEPRLPGLSKYTPEQLFFIANAQIWCSSSTNEGILNQVLSDNHSPAKFRIIGPMSNMKEFSKVWQCPPGAPMNPQNKCIVW